MNTTTPTEFRNECLAQDPCYRNSMTAKGYYQSHMLDYYLGADMKQLKPASSIDTSLKYTIKNSNSGLYLSVNERKTESGANVEQSSDEQYWTFKDGGDGYYYLYSEVGDGKTYLLDVDYGKIENGTNIGIYQNTNADAQLFKLVDNLDGAYTIVTKVIKDSSCIGVTGVSKDEGANIIQWECNESADQKWIIEVKSDEVTGDVDSDGVFSISDIVMMKKWLMSSGEITDKEAWDIDKNGAVNIFDLALMKNMAID